MNDFPNECPECEGGTCRELVETYTVTTHDGETVEVPNIPVWRCDQCSAQWLSPEAADAVDAFIAKATEQLTPAELNDFLEKYDLSQTEAAELLGLGEKTIHRWLKGRQVISRSMGHYIRLLLQFPDAVQWLTARGWRGHAEKTVITAPPSKAPAATEIEWSRFPALGKLRNRGGSVSIVKNRLGNPAKGLLPAAVSHFSLQ